MTKLKIFSLAFLLSALTGINMASADVNKQAIDMDTIKAACQVEAKDALYPQEYAEQCIDEKVQALQDEQQDASKEES